MANVLLECVSKRFPDGTIAVDEVTLEIEDREFLVLVGPSGCGKSTTLRLIAGLETGTSGEIRIGGRVVTGVSPKDRDIAMVFQNYALYPQMSVYKNLSFGLSLRSTGIFGVGVLSRGLRKIFQPQRAVEIDRLHAGIDDKVRQTALRLGIEDLLDRMPHQLSGGERQRVALGRAIVRKPAAFLFD
jgi:multiple sugar transport system ATP-binding protein